MVHFRRMLGGFILVMSVMAEVMASGVEYSKEEMAWLKAHPQLRVGIINTNSPILYLGEANQPRGVAADYLRFVAEKAGAGLKVVRFNEVSAMERALKDGEIDMVGATTWSVDRASSMRFTQPYLSIPGAIYTRKNGPLLTPTEMDGRAVAVVRGGFWSRWVNERYPNIRRVEVSGALAGLQSVNNGLVDAYLGDIASSRYHLKRQGIDRLQEYGAIGGLLNLVMAVDSNQALVASILEKSIALITPEEHASIRRRWSNIGEAPSLTDNETVRGALIIVLLLGWFVGWYLAFRWLVKRKVSRRTKSMKNSLLRRRKIEKEMKHEREQLKTLIRRAKRKIRSIQGRLNLLSEALPFGFWEWDLKRNRYRWDKGMCRLAGELPGTFGGTPHEVLSKIHPDDRDRVVDRLTRAMSKNAVSSLEYRLLRSDGSVIWVVNHYRTIRNSRGCVVKQAGVTYQLSEHLQTKLEPQPEPSEQVKPDDLQPKIGPRPTQKPQLVKDEPVTSQEEGQAPEGTTNAGVGSAYQGL
ncbi:transporter substrate-binding domain-containing protein [Candidatus Endoriftia persephone]|uniref:Extracellular solute-binding protein, family 3 n=3 Tax=Gammaproteobacteria TaxID=1236 RepID=G2FF37_9GAMM|nr:transporter substrate-binding domain-containing protein [Candidatus Endoriftia persephone]EGV49984.1 extracellular solute-binding protein, family 3 [endosymbiont of Riftia pachyptila (vent Ph05)]EGW54584.1 extracellular solute-binding protein, family 3 [endosymbiont of Tevnia jerichonana (vent Tica)]USF87532.1 transporter substrate-binding domain-containing protein [Candidatus Endoriftia persephone]